MSTWGDVTRVFICCALVIFWFISFLFMWEMHEEIRSVRRDVDKLMIAQRPLVKWATWKQQERNKRNNHLIKISGEKKTMIEWAEDERCKISYTALRTRIHKGWDPEKAVMQE